MNKNTKTQRGKTKLAKRVGTVALAATVALSFPAVSNVVSHITPFDQLQTTVAHAQQTDNLMVSNETLTTFHINHNDEYEHWNHTFTNDGEVPVNGPDFDISNLTYVVKLPQELSHLLDDNYVLDYLFGNITNFDSAQTPFTITGYIIDENGEESTIAKDTHKPYEHISINQDTNSIEFDFNSFYTDNNIEPYFRQNVDGEWFLNNLGFSMSFNVPDDRMLHNGTYEFKTAIVEGNGVDLDNVSGAYSENLVVDYSTDPEPEPEPEVDTSELEALVEEANGYDADEYTEDSFAALTAAVAAADEVLADDDATQEDVDSALAELQTAIDGLEEDEEDPAPEVDKSELEELGRESASYLEDEEKYTEDSFEAFLEVVKAADSVYQDEEATQDEVDAAVVELQAAIDSLVEADSEPENPSEVDTSELEALVKEANGYDADEYTENSLAALTAAVAAADEVIADEEATQEDVDLAKANLQAAINGLIKIDEEDPEPTPEPEDPEDPAVDTSELEALIEDAKAYDEDEYTNSTFTTLTEAIDAAESILEDDDATQEDIDSALEDLQSAIDGLEEVENGNGADEEDGDRLPDTATNTYTLMMMGGLLAAVGGVLFFMRRRVA